jgi:hypothetical protein
MESTKYVKKQDLVGVAFTIEKVWPAQYTVWDNVARTMLKSDVPKKGHSKNYNVVTNKGTVGVSAYMLGNFFEAVQKDGNSTIIGATFNLKSNGKEGKEVRYFIDVVEVETPAETPGPPPLPEEEETLNADDIPF